MPRALWIACLLSLAATSTWAQAPNKIQGAWKVVERSLNAGSASNKNPQPSLYIFTAKHYSIQVDMADKPRPDAPTDVSKATAQELLAVWEPFVANSGTYEVKGTEITVRSIVAKNPQATGGGFRVYTFKFEGDALILTPIRTGLGPITGGGWIKMVRLE